MMTDTERVQMLRRINGMLDRVVKGSMVERVACTHCGKHHFSDLNRHELYQQLASAQIKLDKCITGYGKLSK